MTADAPPTQAGAATAPGPLPGAGVAGIAGAFMALVAVAATAAAVPAPAMNPATDCRAAVMESQPVRAVAAVVAAACDLLGIDRSTDAAAAPMPVADAAPLSQKPPVMAPLANVHSPAPPLREALLNLPPPIC